MHLQDLSEQSESAVGIYSEITLREEGEIEAVPRDYLWQRRKVNKGDYMALQHRRFKQLTPNRKLRN